MGTGLKKDFILRITLICGKTRNSELDFCHYEKKSVFVVDLSLVCGKGFLMFMHLLEFICKLAMKLVHYHSIKKNYVRVGMLV